MRGIDRLGVMSTRLLAALLTAAALLVASAGAAAVAATPSPTPTPASTATADPALRLGVQLGGISLNVSLPLTLGGLLGVGNAGETSPTPSPTPTSSTPGQPPASSTSSKPKPASSHTRTASAPPVQGGFGQPPATRSSSARHPKHHSSPTGHPTSSKKSKPRGGLLLTQRVLPNSGAVLLVSVIVVLALGVAAFVRLSGRRGGHQV